MNVCTATEDRRCDPGKNVLGEAEVYRRQAEGHGGHIIELQETHERESRTISWSHYIGLIAGPGSKEHGDIELWLVT